MTEKEAMMAELNPTAKIAKNSLVQLVAGIINKLLGVLLVIYAARQLGTVGFGTYSYVLSLYAIFYIITDFGLGTITTRDVAQDSSRESVYLGHTLILRFFLSLVAALGLILTVWALRQPALLIKISAIVALSLFFTSAVDSCSALFNAHQRMEIPSAIAVIAATLRITASLGALAGGAGVVTLIWIQSVMSAVQFIIIFITLRQFVRPNFHMDWSFAKHLLRQAYPLALANLFSVVYFRVDTVMLGVMKDQSSVGIYNAAYRLLEFTLIFPAYYGGAIFPVIASSFKVNQQRFLLIYRRSLKYMWIITLPMALGVTMLGPTIIRVLYGQAYIQSVQLLSVLMWSLLIIALNSVSAPYLIVMEKQRIVTVFALVMMLFNMVLNAVFIPAYGALGAAGVTLGSEVINSLLYVIVLAKPLSLNLGLLRYFVKPALAGLIMVVLLYFIGAWDMGFQIVLGAAVYGISLLALGGFDEIDHELFSRILKPNAAGTMKVTD